MAATSRADDDERYKDEMELYEMDPLMEEDERSHNDDDEHMLHANGHERQYDEDHPPAPTELPSTPPRATGTEYLDGLRGLAAVCVFIQHFIGGYGRGRTEYGWGQGGNYFITTFPFFRVLFSGGNAAVVIFFILSGYVLTIAPLKKLARGDSNDMRRALLAAVIRRPFRLYIPPITICFIVAMLLHVPGPLMLPTGWEGGKPQEGGIVAELAFFWEKLDFFSIFHEHGSHLFAYPYNVVMWTLPIELKGSLLVYGVLFILSLGLSGPDVKAPMMAAAGIFTIAAAMVQRNWRWSLGAFLFGVFLAIVDTWPIGEQVWQTLQPPERVKELYSKYGPRAPGFVYTIRDRWENARAIKLTPEWITNSIPERFRPDPKKPRKPRYETPFSLWAHVCFWVGWYLISEPSHAGMIEYSADTPGWGWLTKQIPAEYGEMRYYRYWQTWGSLLVVYAVLRIGWLQRFFTTRMLRFFGYVSFMLYLIHLPWFRILPDRFAGLIGGDVDPNLFGSFWDKGFVIPDIGPVALSTRFWVAFLVAFPSSLLIAWGATKVIDQPSVKLGRWITTVIGLDKKKPGKESTESVQLPR